MKHITAIIKEETHDKYDLPQNEWEAYANLMVDSVADAGFTCINPPVHKPADVKGDRQYMDKKLYLMDRAHEAGLAVILEPGGTAQAKWGHLDHTKYPYHELHDHPSVIAVRKGDEPDQGEWEDERFHFDNIINYTPDRELITVMIGESIGGPSNRDYCNNVLLDNDRLPEYESWWAEYPDNHVPTVRNYPFRFRNKIIHCENGDDIHEQGEYHINSPYVPNKLAVSLREMVRIMDSRYSRWNLVAPAFGKCHALEGEDCYWSFPTYDQVLQYGAVAAYSNVDMLMFWGCTPNNDGNVFFWDSDFNKVTNERDGSVPVDAIKVIKELYRL